MVKKDPSTFVPDVVASWRFVPARCFALHRYACPTKGGGCVMRPPHRTEFEKYHRVPDGVKLVTAAGVRLGSMGWGWASVESKLRRSDG